MQRWVRHEFLHRLEDVSPSTDDVSKVLDDMAEFVHTYRQWQILLSIIFPWRRKNAKAASLLLARIGSAQMGRIDYPM
jgi:hypothetical protein